MKVMEERSETMGRHRLVTFLASDDACRVQFALAMNEKCIQLKMNNTLFQNTHGLSSPGQISTSRDMLLLALYTLGNEILSKIWCTRNYTIYIKGPQARKISLNSLAAHPILDEEFTFLGGKTGTVNPRKTNVLLVLADKDSNIFVTTVMGAISEEKRFIDAKKLASAAQKKLLNPDYQFEESLTANSGSVLAVRGKPFLEVNSCLPSTFSINENNPSPPASLTKVMTSLILLETISDLDETFTFKESDITGGSGPQICPDDIISFRDALYLMMLPSSNSTATAIGRVVGRRLIAKRGIY